MWPAPTLRVRPCLMAFSTSGWRIMLGTIRSRASGAMSLRHPAWAESDHLDVEYSSMDSSSSRSVTNCS